MCVSRNSPCRWGNTGISLCFKHWKVGENVDIYIRHGSGQIITTSAEVTLNGGLIRELPQNPLNSGLGIILICPDGWYATLLPGLRQQQSRKRPVKEEGPWSWDVWMCLWQKWLWFVKADEAKKHHRRIHQRLTQPMANLELFFWDYIFCRKNIV